MADSDGDLGAWLLAANPMTAAVSELEALRAARVGAVSAALMGVQAIVGGLWAYLNAGRLIAATQASMAATYHNANVDPAMAASMANGMAQMMPMVILVSSVVFGIIELILAAVQWRRPNLFIPAILLALVALGLLSTLRARLMQPQLAAAASSPGMLAYMLVSDVIHIVLLLAAIRGALTLGRMRRGAVV